MLDIRLFREQPDFVQARLATRGGSDSAAVVSEILACDAHRRQLETRLQTGNADRNRLSKEIGQKRARKEDSSLLEAEVRTLGDTIADLNRQATEADEEQRRLLLNVPNLPHPGATVGKDAADNPAVRTWGANHRGSRRASEPEDHLKVGARLGLFDLERAAKISGSGFVLFTGLGARLQRALISFLLDLHGTQHGYTEIAPPFVVKRDCMVGTTQLPEVRGRHVRPRRRGHVPDSDRRGARDEPAPRGDPGSADTLPRKFCAYTPCFRREAGSAGRETRGLIRVHQFDKVELVKLTTPETSYAELESSHL